MGAFYSVYYSLCQASQHVGERFLPSVFVFVAFYEVSVIYKLSCYVINYGIGQDIAILMVQYLYWCWLSMVRNESWYDCVVTFISTVFVPGEVFVCRLGNRNYWIHFHP